MLTKEQAKGILADRIALAAESKEYREMSANLYKQATTFPDGFMEAMGFTIGAIVVHARLGQTGVVTRLRNSYGNTTISGFKAAGEIGRALSYQFPISPLHSADWQPTGENVSEAKLARFNKPPR